MLNDGTSLATKNSGQRGRTIQHHIGTNGFGAGTPGGVVPPLRAHLLAGGAASGFEEKALMRSLSCERFEEILCTREVYSVEGVPRVQIIGIGGVVTIIQ